MSSIFHQSIIQDPDKILHTTSTTVTDFEEAKKIVNKLIDVTKMVDRPLKFWLGMAAPQIGYTKRIFILRNSYRNYTVMINPEILAQKWLLPLVSKCYSLAGQLYLTKYHFWFKVNYQNLDERWCTEVIRGGRAAALQQELDHINGVMLSDKGKRLL